MHDLYLITDSLHDSLLIGQIEFYLWIIVCFGVEYSLLSIMTQGMEEIKAQLLIASLRYSRPLLHQVTYDSEDV